jgi:hypothetical protein
MHPSTKRKRCAGMALDSKHILVRCSESLRPIRTTRRYHSPACAGWTRARRAQHLHLGDSYIKGRRTKRPSWPPKVCKGWTVREGVIAKCAESFAPASAVQKYHSIECGLWTRARRAQLLRLGDVYIKRRRTKRHPAKACVRGWALRDGVIVKCTELFTGGSNQRYHSTACRIQTLRWRKFRHLLGDSVQRTCSYRNCRDGEGGTKKTVDRIQRSPNGEYYCSKRHQRDEKNARRADVIALGRKVRDGQPIALITEQAPQQPRRGRGNPGDPKKQEQYKRAAELYPTLGSWGKVAKRIVPAEFERDPKGAANRLRLGAEYHQQI